jgi:DNA-binding IclR family transcriptional regulator
VAVDNEENAQGIICIGGPIFASGKQPIAALSVSGPSVRMSQNVAPIKMAVRETVQTISTLLGGDIGSSPENEKIEQSTSSFKYQH